MRGKIIMQGEIEPPSNYYSLLDILLYFTVYFCRFVWCTTYGAGSLADSLSLSMNTNVICTVSIPLQNVLTTNTLQWREYSIKLCKTWNSTSFGMVTCYTLLKCMCGTSFEPMKWASLSFSIRKKVLPYTIHDTDFCAVLRYKIGTISEVIAS